MMRYPPIDPDHTTPTSSPPSTQAWLVAPRSIRSAPHGPPFIIDDDRPHKRIYRVPHQSILCLRCSILFSKYSAPVISYTIHPFHLNPAPCTHNSLSSPTISLVPCSTFDCSATPHATVFTLHARTHTSYSFIVHRSTHNPICSIAL